MGPGPGRSRGRGGRGPAGGSGKAEMRVLVAGASGAIGMPLVRLLRHAGHEVVAVHRAPGGCAPLAKAGAVPIQTDVLDRRSLTRALSGQWADAVIAELTALKRI